MVADGRPSREEALAAMRERARATLDEAANPKPPPDRCSENAKAFLVAYGELCQKYGLRVEGDAHSGGVCLCSLVPYPSYGLPGYPTTEAEVLAQHLQELATQGD